MRINSVDIDKLVDEITREVMFRLREQEELQPMAPGRVCTPETAVECLGLCVAQCPDKCRHIVEAGASRIAITLGAAASAQGLAGLIDHTLLKPEATADQIAQLCYEARKYNFAAVCVNPNHVKLCAELLRGSPVRIATVVGFPLGAHTTETKVFETQQTIADGAHEIDMVMNIGALKAGDYELVEQDIRGVVEAAHARGAIVKVILETALLTDEEKVKACTLSKAAGADFVKTSTGFGPGGATVKDVALMRAVVGPDIGIKAAGGIRDYVTTAEMVKAGATRIGASAGVKIVQEAATGR